MSTLKVYKEHKIWCILRGKKRVVALMFKNSLKQSLINLFPKGYVDSWCPYIFCFCHLLQNYKKSNISAKPLNNECNGNFLKSNLNETFAGREILHTFKISQLSVWFVFLNYSCHMHINIYRVLRTLLLLFHQYSSIYV